MSGAQAPLVGPRVGPLGERAPAVPDAWEGRLLLETRGVWSAANVEQLLLAYAVSAGTTPGAPAPVDAYQATTRAFWLEAQAVLVRAIRAASANAISPGAECEAFVAAVTSVRAAAIAGDSRIVATRVLADLSVIGLGAIPLFPPVVPRSGPPALSAVDAARRGVRSRR